MILHDREEKIEEYGRGFELFVAALAECPREAWEFKPAPNEWSVHEIIIHMADSETIGAVRARKLIAEPGSTLMPYDETGWAVRLNYAKQNLEDALQTFRLARQTTYNVLKIVPDSVFEHQVFHPERVHPEYGERYTLDKWLYIYTAHIREHIGQMQKNYQAWTVK
jgi:hypothetical protein